jgi:membrane associated rhomboid family serine protease
MSIAALLRTSVGWRAARFTIQTAPMIPTPELNFRRAPVTLILGVLALGLEVVCFLDPERRSLYYNDFRLGIWIQIWEGEWWRPFTTTLLQGGLLHAAFNVYWLMVFGPVLEGWLGSLRTLALIVLLASFSSLAEFVLWPYVTGRPAAGTVGLSGVIYGLFGILWVAARHRPEFREVCNKQTVQTFVVWFFFCILSTWLDWMQVANLAHAAGLALGVLVGLAVFQNRRRWLWIPAASLISITMLATMIAAPGNPQYEQWREYHRLLRLQQELRGNRH